MTHGFDALRLLETHVQRCIRAIETSNRQPISPKAIVNQLRRTSTLRCFVLTRCSTNIAVLLSTSYFLFCCLLLYHPLDSDQPKLQTGTATRCSRVSPLLYGHHARRMSTRRAQRVRLPSLRRLRAEELGKFLDSPASLLPLHSFLLHAGSTTPPRQPLSSTQSLEVR